MRARCPSCSAEVGWSALFLSPTAPLYVRCRACRTRLRPERASNAIHALFVGSLVAGAVLLAAAEFGGFGGSVGRVVLWSVLAGVACALVAGAMTLAGPLVAAERTAEDRRYLWVAPAAGLVMVLVVAVFAVVAAMQSGLSRPPPSPGTSRIGERIDEQDRAWRWVALDGDETTLGETLDRPLVLNAWATWCPPCVEELPSFAALRDFLGDGVAFAFVSDESLPTVRAFAARSGLDLPFYSGESAPPRFRTAAIPATWILDRNGELVDHVLGAADWNRDEIRVRLTALANEPEPDPEPK
ncbi:MAG: TlpA family protein disulfide reductase [Planctomycetota bacterium JB042]